jgi:hypothetical protein
LPQCSESRESQTELFGTKSEDPKADRCILDPDEIEELSVLDEHNRAELSQSLRLMTWLTSGRTHWVRKDEFVKACDSLELLLYKLGDEIKRSDPDEQSLWSELQAVCQRVSHKSARMANLLNKFPS